MGILKLFGRSKPSLVRLPAGSLTVDRSGQILVSTLPQSFPAEWVRDIADRMSRSFRAAQAAQLPLTELVVHYPALKITARELRGGVLIFLSPREMSTNPN